jgi:NADH pyrophosphatase NudC (nudix superfamily)
MPIDNPTRMNGDVIDFENSVEDLLKRETREEAGIEIGNDFEYINSVSFIRPDGIPVILLKFAAKYVSGEVVPEEGGFTDYKWVDAQEVKEYDCIQGVHYEIEKTIQKFS